MELAIHLPTLIALSVLHNLLIAGILWMVYQLRNRQPCFRLWSLACLSFVAGSILAAARTVIDAPEITVFMAHLLLGLSSFLVLAGFYSFDDGKQRPSQSNLGTRWIILGGAYIGALLLTFDADTLDARLLNAGFSALVFSAATFRLHSLNQKPTNLPSRILQFLFALHALLLIVQIGFAFRYGMNEEHTPLQEVLTLALVNHVLLTTAAAMVLPLFAFTRSESSLREMAECDYLTGLLNRRAFFKASRKAFEEAQEHGRVISTLMIDLDHFKQVNDRWGHAVGDDALRLVAEIMKAELRNEDILGRIGGEEFAAVVRTGSREEVERIAKRLLSAIQARGKILEGVPLELSASIGGAIFEAETGSLEKLLGKADNALYRAKGNGRNRLEIHDQAQSYA